MPSHIPYIHSGDPAYAPPVLRAPSPSSSIGTEYEPDETTEEELRMSDEDFARMCEDNLKLGKPRQDEIEACKDPLLPRPRSREEEQRMVHLIMQSLRNEVRLLEENNMFEQTVLRGSLVTEELQPTSDIDAIMRGMMGPPQSLPTFSPFSDGFLSRPEPDPSFVLPEVTPANPLTYEDFVIEPTSAIASTPAASKLRPRNKGKARRP